MVARHCWAEAMSHGVVMVKVKPDGGKVITDGFVGIIANNWIRWYHCQQLDATHSRFIGIAMGGADATWLWTLWPRRFTRKLLPFSSSRILYEGFGRY
ncbi:hypothetical protein PVK06_045099 [Gossypium arboreum]|uniref:Uncharacterized protein n=1 Tax=Gossypium arboreum TaxID=29729 RepID=A0ABR0MT32_GOSAR|nr:hypothetical protein PVK06_045099 [Gossypium arboreum]